MTEIPTKFNNTRALVYLQGKEIPSEVNGQSSLTDGCNNGDSK